jgi:murein DD-endopeptidase MepM/ murein hydrolase activator NlpD
MQSPGRHSFLRVVSVWLGALLVLVASSALGIGRPAAHALTPDRQHAVSPQVSGGPAITATPIDAAAPSGAAPWRLPRRPVWSGPPDLIPPETRELIEAFATTARSARAEGEVRVRPAPGRPAPLAVFPVVAAASYTDDFGAPRPEGRTHKGVDIFAEKLAPVVAVAPGVITGVGSGAECCWVRVGHDAGGYSLYLHLNNDSVGTDDGLGSGLADGIAVGTRVEAGTLIGYVGDSGNAEETSPHLHFEYHSSQGEPVDPYPLLTQAQGLSTPVALRAQPAELPNTGVAVISLLLVALSGLLAGSLIVGRHRSLRGRARITRHPGLPSAISSPPP